MYEQILGETSTAETEKNTAKKDEFPPYHDIMQKSRVIQRSSAVFMAVLCIIISVLQNTNVLVFFIKIVKPVLRIATKLCKLLTITYLKVGNHIVQL